MKVKTVKLNGLRQRRRLLDYTQEKLGAKMGVGWNTVRRWEAGERYPSLDTLVKLTEILNCTIDYLIHGENLDYVEH